MGQLLPPGGGTWVNFCWVCATGLSEPLHHYGLFCGQLPTPSSRSQLSHFLLVCIYPILNEEHFTFHLQYKHSGTFANRKYEELSQKMCDPLMVNPVVKMRPHPVAHPHQSLIRKQPPPGGFCADTKTIPDRASLHTYER